MRDKMENVRNLNVMCTEQCGSYRCTVDLYDAWTKTWDTVPYTAQRGDPAPVNIWIIEQIDTGVFGAINACPIPAPPVPPSEVQGENGPTVA